MESLREQLLKAKLVDKKSVKKAAHADRVQRKERGRAGHRQDADRKQEERHQRRLQRREEDRTREQNRQATRKTGGADAGDRARAVRLAVEVGGAEPPKPGKRRFHFIDGRGRIPFLELDDGTVRRLSAGECAIVELQGEHPQGHHMIVDARTARQVRRIDPEAVRFLQDSAERSR